MPYRLNRNIFCIACGEPISALLSGHMYYSHFDLWQAWKKLEDHNRYLMTRDV